MEITRNKMHIIPRVMSLLLSAVLLIVSVWTLDVSFVKATDTPDGTIKINYNSDGGSVAWKSDLLGDSPFCPIREGDSIGVSMLSNDNNADPIYATKVYIKAEPNEGYKFDDNTDGVNYTQLRVRVTPESGEGHDIYINDLEKLRNGEYYIEYNHSCDYEVTISFVSDNGGSGGSSNVESGKYKVDFRDDSGHNCKATLQFVNGEATVGGSIEVSASINETEIPENATGFRIEVDNTYREYFAGIRVNEEHEGEDEIRNNGSFTFTRSPSDGYNIEIEFSNKKNVRWRYPGDPEAAWDEIVEHARIYLLKTPNASDIYYGELGSQSAEDGGDFNLVVGETYYFLLEPDYGYQISTIRINDCIDLYPIDGQTGVFSFTMANSNFHFKGIVTTVDNPEVQYSGSNISNPSMVTDENMGIHGNIEMVVSDATIDSSAVSQVEGGNEMEAVSSVDISTYQIVSKGGDYGYWKDQKTEFSGNVYVSIGVPASELADGETYSVIRNHNGEYQEVDAVYNSTRGELSFPSSKFSTYTIVKKAGTPVTDPAPSSDNGQTSSSSDDTDEAVTVEVVDNTTLGTVVGGSVVKDWDGLEKILENKTSTGNKTTDGNTTAAPIVLTLNQRNSTVPVSTLRALEASESVGLHLMMGNGVAITIANGAGLKNQPAINLSSKIETMRNSKTISFASNTKLNALVALHMSVPKNVKEVKLYYYINGHAYFLGTLTTINGQVLFPISQLGIYKLVY